MAQSALAKLSQASFAAGFWRSGARDRIPANGAHALLNCVLSDAGDAPRRGGTEYLTSSAFGTGLTFLWDGILGTSQRTLVANRSDFGRVNRDGTVTNLGGNGLQYPVNPAVFKGKLYLPRGITFDGTTLGTASKLADCYIAAGGRLLACRGNKVFESLTGSDSEWVDPETGLENFHELPEGARVLGGEGTRDRVALFTTQGCWLISNIELDLTDEFGNVQQSLDVFDRNLRTVSGAGIASWSGGVIVPAVDGIWLMGVGQDAANAPPPLTKISKPISELYLAYMRQGYRPGGAVVYRDHYLLPILSGSRVIDLLVCKLNRVVDQDGSRAWTQFNGHGADVSCFTVRVSTSQRQPRLLGALRGATSKVITARYFDENAAIADADGSAPLWEIVTRDYVSGSQTKSFFKKLRVEALLTNVGADTPTVTAEYATEEPAFTYPVTWNGTTWNGAYWSAPVETYTAMTGAAPEDATGATPYVYRVNKNAERIRFRLRCDDLTTKANLRSVETHLRPTGRF